MKELKFLLLQFLFAYFGDMLVLFTYLFSTFKENMYARASVVVHLQAPKKLV